MSRMQDSCLQRVPHQFSADVQVWWVDLDAYAATVTLDGLSAQEHARAASMAFGQDARRFLASRHALRHVLANALDRLPEGLVIEPDDFGKPHLLQGSAPHFNLSHSGYQGLIGVSLDRPIGVDIEVVLEVVDADALVGAHFTADEREEWLSAPDPLRDRAFLTCWTRKEACVKALGVGLSLQPASIGVGCATHSRVVGIPIGTGRCEVAVCSLRLPGKSVAAVAVATPEAVGIARQFSRRPASPSSLGSVESVRC